MHAPRRSLTIATALFATAALAACSATGSAGSGKLEGTVTFGSPYDTSGVAAVASIGKDERNGAELAAKEINESNFLGTDVELKLRQSDTKASKEQSVQTIIDLTMNDPVDAVVGFTLTPNFLAAAPRLKDAGLPVMAVGLSGDGVTEAGDNFYRIVRSLNDLYADSDAAVLDALKPATAAYLFNEDVESNVAQKDFRQELAESKGVETVADEGAASDAIDLRRQLTSIKSADPDLLYVQVTGSNILTVLTQMEQVGLKTQLMGDPSWSLEDVVRHPAANCTIFTTSWSPASDAGRNSEFVAAYEKEYGQPASAFSAYAYDGVWAMATAMKEADSTKASDVLDALKDLKLSGALGDYSFDDNREPTQAPITLQIVDGQEAEWTADSNC